MVKRIRAIKPRVIVLPEDGVGTGIANLPLGAPATFAALNEILKQEIGVAMQLTNRGWRFEAALNTRPANEELALAA